PPFGIRIQIVAGGSGFGVESKRLTVPKSPSAMKSHAGVLAGISDSRSETSTAFAASPTVVSTYKTVRIFAARTPVLVCPNMKGLAAEIASSRVCELPPAVALTPGIGGVALSD